jgi:flagellar basal-body rod protein FlgB
MASISALDREFAPHLKALNLRAARGAVLAGNVANADTPHYKARDFDFASAMREASAGQALRLARTAAAHLDPKAGMAGAPRLQYRVPAQPSIDGNTVELDQEVARFSDNAMRYQAAVTFTNARVRDMLAAITGQ